MLKKKAALSFLLIIFSANFTQALRLEIKAEERDKQEKAFSASLTFAQAFEQALISFFTQSLDEESLLAVLIDKYPAQELMQSKLKQILDDNTTTLRLLSSSELCAPHGENISDNWIFTLKTSISDHVFYAIINRQGTHESYNYGFN